MTSPHIKWYSLDEDMRTCEHPPVDLHRALEIAEGYYARGEGRFDSAEEAVSATMFGFSRSSTEFIEFCINGPSEISYKFEFADPTASLLRRIFGGTFQFEAVLHSKMELTERVQEFFALPPAAIKAKLQSGK